MKFILYDDTPQHRNAFIRRSEAGKYNETLFYRVIEGFMIQGGAADSRGAYKGKQIGYGDPEETVDDEIQAHRFCKKGALCAPRQPDEVNPFKQSDISQFFVIQGRVISEGRLDTMELAVNRPIRKKIVKEVYTPEKREKLQTLKAEMFIDEARDFAHQIKLEIATKYKVAPGKLEFSEAQRVAYSSIGGSPELDGDFTVFGEMIQGFDVIDKIAKMKTDKNNRPYNDVKIIDVIIIEQ